MAYLLIRSGGGCQCFHEHDVQTRTKDVLVFCDDYTDATKHILRCLEGLRCLTGRVALVSSSMGAVVQRRMCTSKRIESPRQEQIVGEDFLISYLHSNVCSSAF